MVIGKSRIYWGGCIVAYGTKHFYISFHATILCDIIACNEQCEGSKTFIMLGEEAKEIFVAYKGKNEKRSGSSFASGSLNSSLTQCFVDDDPRSGRPRSIPKKNLAESVKSKI